MSDAKTPAACAHRYQLPPARGADWSEGRCCDCGAPREFLNSIDLIVERSVNPAYQEHLWRGTVAGVRSRLQQAAARRGFLPAIES